MSATYLRQSTATQGRRIGPFVSDTDFKTPNDGLTIAGTDIKLSKNGAVAVNASAGATSDINGMYGVSFSAADTNIVGELEVSILVAGALVVTARFMVVEEAIYDALFAAGANGFDSAGVVQANITQILGGALGEVSANNLSANFSTFYDNGDSITSKTVDQIDNVNTWLGSPPGNLPDTALSAIQLDKLISTTVGPSDVVANSIIANMVSKSVTPVWTSFDNTTDSLEALADASGSDVNVISWAGTAVTTPLTPGVPNVNMMEISGGALSPPATTTLLADNFSVFYGNANALTTNTVDDVGVGVGGTNVNVISWAGTAVATPTIAGVPKVDVDYWKGVVADDPMTITDFFTAGVPLNTTGGTIDLVTTTTQVSNSVGQTQDVGPMIGTNGAALTALGGMSSGMQTQVQSNCDAALVAMFLDRLFLVDYNPAAPPGVATSWANELVQDNGGGITQFTTIALANTGFTGTVDANLTQILGTAVIEPIGGAGTSGLAENFSIFFDVDPTTIKTVDDVGGGGVGGTDWTATERNNIRYRLGVDGTTAVPATNVPNLETIDANLTQILGTVVTEPIGGGGSSGLAENFSFFFDINPTTTRTIDSLSIHSASDVRTDMDTNSTISSRIGVANSLGAGATLFLNLSDIAGVGFISASDSLSAGGAGLTVQQIVNGVWDEQAGDHTIVGSTGETLIAGAASSDPWPIQLPGPYIPGSAGRIIADALTGHIAQTGDSYNRIGLGGTNLNDLGGMSTAMKAEIKTQTDLSVAALNDFNPAIDQVIVGSMAANSITSLVLATGAITALSMNNDVSVQHRQEMDTSSTQFAQIILDVAAVPNVQENVNGVWNAQTSAHTQVGSTGAALVAGNAPTVAQIVSGVWDAQTNAYTILGSMGRALSDTETNVSLITGVDGVTLATVQGNYAVSTVTTTEVRTEMVGALTVDVYGEPPKENPPENASLATKIGYGYKLDVNRKDQDATSFKLWNFATTIVDQETVVTGDATSATKGKLTVGT